VLKHDGCLLYETQAILRYLDRVLPKPALTPADPRRASRMDQVMNVNDWYLYQGVGTVIVFHRVIGPRLMGLTPDEAAIAAAMPKALAVFNELAHLLGEQRYFAGDAISLADLMVAPAVELFTATPEWSVLGAPHANLESWLARMQALPSMQATTWERVSELGRHSKAHADFAAMAFNAVAAAGASRAPSVAMAWRLRRATACLQRTEVIQDRHRQKPTRTPSERAD
jgi:glutathione S-transferase